MCRNREGLSGIDGYAAELGLATELPAAIAQYRGHWIEYGVAERAYALQCPDDFTAIVSRYGHTAIRPKQYTASAFLAAYSACQRAWIRAVPLGSRDRTLEIRHHQLVGSSAWPDWESSRLSWSDIGQDMSYVPGAAGQ